MLWQRYIVLDHKIGSAIPNLTDIFSSFCDFDFRDNQSKAYVSANLALVSLSGYLDDIHLFWLTPRYGRIELNDYKQI